jgi:hypothetical protein
MQNYKNHFCYKCVNSRLDSTLTILTCKKKNVSVYDLIPSIECFVLDD